MFRFTATLLVTASIAQCIALYGGLVPLVPSLVVNAFMFGLTLVVYRIVSGIDDVRRFTQVYLATIVIKILAACSFAVVLIILDPANGRSNVILLLILYIAFTAIEVGFLVRSRRSSTS
jgi:hypothetical protein